MNKRRLEQMTDEVIKIGEMFDEIKHDESRYCALIMLLTVYCIDGIKKDAHEAFLHQFVENCLDNIKALEEFRKSELAHIETEGNA